MKKSAQDREIEKLKKQVEKLKKEKESLQRDKRNLKGRLSTAQSNNAKYHWDLVSIRNHAAYSKTSDML